MIPCLLFSAEYQLVMTVTHGVIDRRWYSNVINIVDVGVLINRHDNESNWHQLMIWTQDYPEFSEAFSVMLCYLAKCDFIDLPVTVTIELRKFRENIGRCNVRILHWLMQSFPLSDRRRGAWFITANNAQVVWRKLLELRPKALRLGVTILRVFVRRNAGKSLLATLPDRIRTLLTPNS